VNLVVCLLEIDEGDARGSSVAVTRLEELIECPHVMLGRDSREEADLGFIDKSMV
jgi:hypothetical protein